jgi:hypothetical protein
MQAPTPIVIHIGRQTDGCAYDLNPLSEREVKKRFPDAHGVPIVFVGYGKEADFEVAHGPLWMQIAMMLTGLTAEQIEEMGGISLYDPAASDMRKVA